MVVGTEVTLAMWETGCVAEWGRPPYPEHYDPKFRQYVLSQEPSDVVDVAAIEVAQHATAVAMALPPGPVRVWRLVAR